LEKSVFKNNQTLSNATFGASTVLLFGIFNSPFFQTRNLIIGNLLGGVVSAVFL